MRERKYRIYLDSQERKLLIHSLVELKNQLIRLVQTSKWECRQFLTECRHTSHKKRESTRLSQSPRILSEIVVSNI